MGLYAFGMGVLCLLGGVRAAADAFEKWGEAAASHHRAASVSSARSESRTAA
jgi:hypothetical protein